MINDSQIPCMSIYRKTGMPSRPGPYYVNIGTRPLYICDASGFNVLGVLFADLFHALEECERLNGIEWDGSVNDEYILSKLRK